MESSILKTKQIYFFLSGMSYNASYKQCRSRSGWKTIFHARLRLCSKFDNKSNTNYKIRLILRVESSEIMRKETIETVKVCAKCIKLILYDFKRSYAKQLRAAQSKRKFLKWSNSNKRKRCQNSSCLLPKCSFVFSFFFFCFL